MWSLQHVDLQKVNGSHDKLFFSGSNNVTINFIYTEKNVRSRNETI